MSFTEVISDNEDLDTKYPGDREEKEESFLYYNYGRPSCVSGFSFI